MVSGQVFESINCVEVDVDEDDVLAAQLSAPLVYAAVALEPGDVHFFGHQEGCDRRENACPRLFPPVAYVFFDWLP